MRVEVGWVGGRGGAGPGAQQDREEQGGETTLGDARGERYTGSGPSPPRPRSGVLPRAQPCLPQRSGQDRFCDGALRPSRATGQQHRGRASGGRWSLRRRAARGEGGGGGGGGRGGGARRPEKRRPARG